MQKEEALLKLREKGLEIKRVEEIYEEFRGDKELESAVAMNLSLRTSIYNKELEKSETIISLLDSLSNSESMEARWAVAKNPHTKAEVLEKLAKDRINLVRALVATNPNTPENILEIFFTDEKIVRDGLSGNPNTPKDILDTLAEDSDKMVRLRVVENPSVEKRTLKRLLDDKSEDVRVACESKLRSECEKEI